MLKPLGNMVLVEPTKVDNSSTSGIIISLTETKKEDEGTILNVGPDVFEVKNGDKVIYAAYAVNPVVIDDKDCVIINEEDILVVIE